MVRIIQSISCNTFIMDNTPAPPHIAKVKESTCNYCLPNSIPRTQLDEDGVEDITMTTMRMIQPAPSNKID